MPVILPRLTHGHPKASSQQILDRVITYVLKRSTSMLTCQYESVSAGGCGTTSCSSRLRTYSWTTRGNHDVPPVTSRMT